MPLRPSSLLLTDLEPELHSLSNTNGYWWTLLSGVSRRTPRLAWPFSVGKMLSYIVRASLMRRARSSSDFGINRTT